MEQPSLPSDSAETYLLENRKLTTAASVRENTTVERPSETKLMWKTGRRRRILDANHAYVLESPRNFACLERAYVSPIPQSLAEKSSQGAKISAKTFTPRVF